MKYWENGFYINQNETNTRKEIEDLDYKSLLEKQSQGFEIFTDDDGFPNFRTKIYTDEEQLEYLRLKRNEECFSVVNRGTVWYDTLSQEQLENLKNWYTDWLNITETKVVPVMPDFIN